MLWWTLQTACVAALLAAVVAVVCRVGRVSPAVKHALWLLVLIKLLTPPLAWYRLPQAVDNRLARWTISPEPYSGELPSGPKHDVFLIDAEVIEAAPTTFADSRLLAPEGPRDVASTGRDGPEFDLLSSQTIPLEPLVAADEPVSRAAHGGPTVFGWYLCLASWLAGAIPLAVIQSLRLRRLSRWVKQSAPAPARLDRLVHGVAARLRIRPPQVVVTRAACSPLVCALGKPRLLWPAALGEQLSDEAREAVVLHELAHLRRRDHWVAWLELAAGLIWWFNPLYWYVRHQLRENAELACDAWVVGLLPEGRRAYAEALIEVTEFVSLAPAAMPAVAMGNLARRTLERRLIMILRERTSYRVSLLGMGLIGLSLLVVLPGFSGGQDSPSQGKAPGPVAATPALVTDTAAPVLADLPDDTPITGITDGVLVVAEENTTGAKVPGERSAANPAAAEEEDRIQTLEAKLAQLLDEVKALRATNPAATQPNKPAEAIRSSRRQIRLRESPAYTTTHYVVGNRLFAADGRRGYDVETLTRAKYKLPEITAQALAAFIQEHVKGDIEARVSGETLTIIASQEDQARIDGFIGLLGEATPPALPGAAGVPGTPPKPNSPIEAPSGAKR